jgi:tRNA G37 N-methylase TrmD
MGVGIMVKLKVEDIANSIKKLKKKDTEMLLLLLSGQGKEIKKRLHEIKSKKVKTLTREETFKGVL